MPRILEPRDMSANAVSLEKFTRTGNTLTVEGSDLGRGQWYQPCYKEGNFKGIAIRSHKTRRVVRFAQFETMRDRDGDVTGWKFQPIDKDQPITEVIVLND
jgi:hypothetical protein